MKLWWTSFGLLVAAGVAVALTARAVANGTLSGAGVAWVAVVLAAASLVLSLVSLRTGRS